MSFSGGISIGVMPDRRCAYEAAYLLELAVSATWGIAIDWAVM